METLVSILVLLLLAAAAAGTAYWYQRKVKQTLPLIRSGGVPVVATRAWTLDPEKGLFPEGDVAGSFQGRNFRCDRASLRGTTLTFRQGKTRPSDMSVSIVLLQPPAAAPTVSTKPGAAGAIPRIILRWRDKETGQQSARFNQGYLLNVAFEPAANERVRGKLYLAVPDEFHTYFAGHFDAEILEPRPPIPVEAEK